MASRMVVIGAALALGLVACGSDDAGADGAAGQGGGAQAGAGGSAQAGSAGSAQAGSAQAGGAQAGGAQAGSGGSGPASCESEPNCYLRCLCEGKEHAGCVDACPGGPAGLKRVVLTTESFMLGPGEEVYRCQDFANPFGQDVEVQATESYLMPGSHHMFAFYKKDATDGALETCSGLEFTSSVHTSQSPYTLFNYPPGVAARIKATDGIRMNLHYINTTDHPIKAGSSVGIYVADPSTVKEQAGQIFFNNLAVFVPSHGPGKATKTCTMPRDIKLFIAGSHMHKAGTHFLATTDDGTKVYESDSWDDTAFRVFDPPMLLKKGQSITFECEYMNTGDKPLTFGESAATNEMCILSGRYFGDGQGEPVECF